MSTMSFDALRPGRRRRATKTEIAAQEARRRWESLVDAASDQLDHARDAASDQLDHARDAAKPQVKRLRSRADDLADAASEQLDHARDVAKPQVKRLRTKAVEVADPIADRLKTELSDATSAMSAQAAKLISEVRDASRIETERVIEAIRAEAEEARAEERRTRVRALIGFTLFGMAAGAILMSTFGPKRRGEDDAAQIESIVDREHAVDPDDVPAGLADDVTVAPRSY